MTTPFTKAAVLEILNTPAASDTFPDMIRRVEALEPVAQPETVPGELLPCPFCGGTNLYWPHGTDPAIIECGGKNGCGARSGIPDDQMEAEAIAAWNRRATRETTPETPTPGQFTTMCLMIEDVVTGRGFDVDPWRRIQDDPPPMDGTKFLAYAKHAQVLNGEFQLTECQFSQGWWGLSPAHNWPASFTHWQPLTKPGETTSAIPEAVKAYLRNALMVGGWRGERE